MVAHWEPGVQYNLGDEVEYEGKRYKIIQPHRSQGDWAPDRTPALWGVVPYHQCDDDYKQKHHHTAHDHEHQQRPPQQWNEPSYGGGAPQKPVQAPQQTVQITHEEQKKNWYDLDDKRKKELEVGGGLAAGIALLGAGYMAYKHHEKSEEEQKALTWGAQNWVRDAQARTQSFYQQGPTGPTAWVLVHGRQFPNGLIVGGEVDGTQLYISRAFHEGGLHVGQASTLCKKGAVVGYASDAIEYDTYEVLVGDMNGLRWIDVYGDLEDAIRGYTLVEGGREADGRPLVIAQAEYRGKLYPGKAGKHLRGAAVVVDGKEHTVEKYRVLAYA